jgi:hypothetical protein
MNELLPTDAETFRKNVVVTELTGKASLHCFRMLLAAWLAGEALQLEVQS